MMKNFNLQCISNEKCLFSETLSPKNHGRVSFDKKGHHDEILASFSVTTTAITTPNHTGERIYSTSSNTRKCFSIKLRS